MKTPDALFEAKTIDEQIEALTWSQNEQFVPSSLNARIMHDLYQVYDSSSYTQQLERSRGRIWQRLGVERGQRENIGVGERRTRMMSDLQQTRGHRTAKVPSSSRQLVTALLETLAAVLFIALLVGSLILTLLATRNHESNEGGSSALQTVIIHMGPASFRPSSVTIHPGTIIRLVNDTNVEHVIENGYWNNDSIAVHLHEPGMPQSPMEISTIGQLPIIAPFNTVGTYHLFDSIHQVYELNDKGSAIGYSYC